MTDTMRGPLPPADARRRCDGEFCSESKDLILTRVKTATHTKVLMLCSACRTKNGA